MEEQPKDRAHDRQHQHHGEERNSTPHKTSLKHDQSHFQRQHQETQTKKTANKKINVGQEEWTEKILHLSEPVAMSLTLNSNGNRHTSSTNVKQKPTQKLYLPVPKVCSRGVVHKKTMDLKNDKEKALDLNHYEGQVLDKKDSLLFPNGIVNCGLITNGYSSKDNDGSGSEGGYTTPKKRKARCNISKNTDNVLKENERDMQQGNTAEEHEALNLDPAEKGLMSRLDGFRSTHRADAPMSGRRAVVSETFVGEFQRKNSDGKTVGTFSKKGEERHKSKLSSPSKEDSWTLFKPPPVFPVDNSSAKIVPKISYASKVKENLNKVAQGGGEAPPPPVRLPQVPMSAMKTITSASFTNGPVSGNLSGTFFAPAANSVPPSPSGENVASSMESNCSSATSPADGDVYDHRKCTLLIYPLNMQPALPSARHLEAPTAQTNQKALGDIFQNQWGLSFINEPNLGPDGGSSPVRVEDKTTAIPAAASAADGNPLFLGPGILTSDPERRTCVPCKMSNPCSHGCEASQEEPKSQPCGQDKAVATAEVGKAVDSAMSPPIKDSGAWPAQGRLTTLLFGSSKEVANVKDTGRRRSWGSFDIKAAVTYHTKEMELVFNLQKQDPKRVVVYDETRDGANQ